MASIRRFAHTAALLFCTVGSLAAQSSEPPAEWTSLFDGKSLKGWKEAPFAGRGKVQVKDGTIVIGSGAMTGITWAGKFPQAGYEVRFEAARLDGSDFFAGITFPVKDSFCSWINGGWGGSLVGLSSLDGEDASENNTTTSHNFVQGQWYKFRLAVTENRIQCWIDGERVIDADITDRKVELRCCEIEANKPLGFASYSTEAGLRKAEYRRFKADASK